MMTPVKEEVEHADTKQGDDVGSANAVGAGAANEPRETGKEATLSDAVEAQKVLPATGDRPDSDGGGDREQGKQGSDTRLLARGGADAAQTTGAGSDSKAGSTRAAGDVSKIDQSHAPVASEDVVTPVPKSEAGIAAIKDGGAGGEGGRADEEEDSSDDDDGDGFRIVVGREAAPSAAAPAMPTKRFLPGTNTLVNTSANSSAGPADSRNTSASKPVSAAAGLASLVPSGGAPAAASRPTLKPGEYPPTAELQQSNGKTAFDVDIDGMEEQPWRHPGVDIADFFNYGFTEESWRVYCEKQLRNRYDQTVGRAQKKKVGGRGDAGGFMRHGGSAGARRGGDQRPIDLHNNGGPGRSSFTGQGPPGWGSGSGRDRFPHGYGFGNGPPSGTGRGTVVSPPWFDGPPQVHPGSRASFGPSPVGVGQDHSAGIVRGMESSGAVRRSLSPDSRGGPNAKMHRVR